LRLIEADVDFHDAILSSVCELRLAVRRTGPIWDGKPAFQLLVTGAHHCTVAVSRVQHKQTAMEFSNGHERNFEWKRARPDVRTMLLKRQSDTAA
jgi:hypothetical protein